MGEIAYGTAWFDFSNLNWLKEFTMADDYISVCTILFLDFPYDADGKLSGNFTTMTKRKVRKY